MPNPKNKPPQNSGPGKALAGKGSVNQAKDSKKNSKEKPQEKKPKEPAIPPFFPEEITDPALPINPVDLKIKDFLREFILKVNLSFIGKNNIRKIHEKLTRVTNTLGDFIPHGKKSFLSEYFMKKVVDPSLSKLITSILLYSY